MLDSCADVAAAIRAGEDSYTEFKSVVTDGGRVRSPNSEAVAGEMVAFANTDGGSLILGVDNDGSIAGLPRDDLESIEQWIVNLARNNCSPPLRPTIRACAFDVDGGERHVLAVGIRQSPFAHRTSGGRWRVRVGTSVEDLDAAELPRLLQERGRTFVFDESPVHDALIEDLDQELIDRALGRPETVTRTQLLQNSRVVVDVDGTLRPTVAGLLCFGTDPSQHLGGAWIHAAAYKGTARDSDDLVDSQEIRAALPRQIDEAVRFVDRLMMHPARKDVGRLDEPEYDLSIVHEAVVNAVAHRDYSIAGSSIRLFLYSDRLEVISPGGLPNTMTIENIRYNQFSRSQLLVSFLSMMRSEENGKAYIESRGEGVGLILDKGREWSGREPRYRLHDDVLSLTIWARPSPHASTT